MAKWGTGEPPKKDGRYLVTAIGAYGRYVAIADRVEYPKGNFTWKSTLGYSFAGEIIAWQRLPQAYKGEVE